MAKNRIVIGSLTKGKTKEDGSKDPNYIKINKDIALKKGQFVKLETQKAQLESLEAAVTREVISEDYAAKQREYIQKIPEFVLAELVVYEERVAKTS
jgi:hypothetical protein